MPLVLIRSLLVARGILSCGLAIVSTPDVVIKSDLCRICFLSHELNRVCVGRSSNDPSSTMRLTSSSKAGPVWCADGDWQYSIVFPSLRCYERCVFITNSPSSINFIALEGIKSSGSPPASLIFLSRSSLNHVSTYCEWKLNSAPPGSARIWCRMVLRSAKVGSQLILNVSVWVVYVNIERWFLGNGRTHHGESRRRFVQRFSQRHSAHPSRQPCTITPEVIVRSVKDDTEPVLAVVVVNSQGGSS